MVNKFRDTNSLSQKYLGRLNDIWQELVPEIRGTRTTAVTLEGKLSGCQEQVTLLETKLSEQAGLSFYVQQPLVSVVVPTFKAEKTIIRALSSLAEQTYHSKEIVIVDDGSQDQDKTVRLIKDFMVSNNTSLRIKFLPLPINMGFAAASRNIALSLASADIVTFLDDDDMLATNESLASLMSPHIRDGNLIASIGDYVICDSEGRPTSSGNVRWAEDKIPPISWEMLFTMDTMLSSIALKKEFAKIPYIERHEDMGPYFEALNEAARIQYEEQGPDLQNTIALVPEVIYKYCRREGSLFTRSDVSDLQRFRQGHAALTYAFTLPSLGLIPGAMEYIKTRYSKHINLRRRARTSSSKDWEEMLKIINTEWLDKPVETFQKEPSSHSIKNRAKAAIPPRLKDAIKSFFKSFS